MLDLQRPQISIKRTELEDDALKWASVFTSLAPHERRALLFRGRIAGYPSASAAFNRPLRPRSAGAAVNISDAEQAFRDEARGFGITLPDKLRSDKIQRFDPGTGNTRGKNLSGFCRFYTDGVPAGLFGDWATGVKEIWSARKLNGTLNEQERLEHHKRVNTLQRERELEERLQLKAVAKEAAELQKGSEPAPDSHPYLLNKQVRAYGLRVHKDHPGKLFMFLQDVCGIIWSYQTIDESGAKRFATGGRKDALFFVIGGPIDPEHMTFIGEGFATMATVHDASGRPCISALDKDNLVKVAKALREVPSYKKAPFTICADSDAWTGHPGEQKAIEAATAIGAPMAVPVFAGPRVYGQTDFNDLFIAEDLGAVRRCLDDAKTSPPGSSEADKDKPSHEDQDQAIERLRKLKIEDYDRCRKAEAAALGVRTSTLDKLVQEARRKAEEARKNTGGAYGDYAAYAAYKATPDFPPDNIGVIANMEMEITRNGQIVSQSYLNAAISIAKHLHVRGRHDVFHNQRWIAFKGKLVKLDDNLISDIHTEAGAHLGTDAGITNVRNVLHYLSGLNPFHPVRDYLNKVAPTWDEKPRRKLWLPKTFGCDAPPEYLERVGEMFLISMVARAQDPGCQVDYMLIIEGDQGPGKSKALRTLVKNPEWFSDSLPILGRDEVRVSMHMRGLWLAEIPEMHAMGKADNDHAKAFITRRVERYVAKYGRTESYEPRQCVLAGTTNRTAYFTDESGNRRYWPIYANKADLNWLENNVDQIWAETMHAYNDSVTWWPSPEFEKEHIKPQQIERNQELPLETPIRAYLDERHSTSDEKGFYWKVGEKGFQFDIWTWLRRSSSSKSDIDFTQQNLRDINLTLRHLGYTNKTRRYRDVSDLNSEREPVRKWWPPEEKTDPKVLDGLGVYPKNDQSAPRFMDDEGCSDDQPFEEREENESKA